MVSPFPDARWRLLVSAPASGADNMALDEALMGRAAATGERVVRVYGWARPTLSLGRNQVARGRYRTEHAREMGVEFVRRPTGGRALLHHHELTYSIAAPAGALGSPRESYTRINRLLVDALARLGVPAAEARGDGAAPHPDTAPCFQAPVAGEIVVNGRKLVGSAQRWNRCALLQHGSVLIDDDQRLASSLLLQPPGIVAPPAATLRELLGRAPDRCELAAALIAALCTREGVTALPLEIDRELDAAVQTARARYVDDAWTWRR